jgi:phosphoribosylamine---glycine ligase
MPVTDLTVLVVGGGGREHALAWAIARSPSVASVHVAPGNGGTALEPKVRNVPLKDGDIEGLVRFARQEAIGLAVIGPEAPLGAGIVDAFRAQRLPVFGPTADAARLETSKVWARDFMARHDIPRPVFTATDDVATAERAVRELGGVCVVKADGLAAGKGVLVCGDVEEGLRAVQSVMVDRKFGTAGEQVLVEERLAGPELSVMVAGDGRSYVVFPPAQDFKRLHDGDEGPNTGGMGSYAPPPIATADVLDAVRRRVVEPTLEGMAAERAAFTGCLYCGLMLTDRGPVVIEYNVRFGDPETQAQLPLLGDDLVEVLRAGAAGGGLDGGGALLSTRGASVCVVLASPGYPEQAETGRLVRGVRAAEEVAGVKVFHAGTRPEGDGVVTSGGRALAVTCVRDDLAAARSGVYEAIGEDGVNFDGMHYRRDIAHRAALAGGAA